VIAEGVEQAPELAELREIGVPLGPGVLHRQPRISRSNELLT
jgi:EAL domain-containing protein (putative c-di-GMP-specific phosphodiesterase class I)